MTPRPAGVYWARAGAGPGARLCCDPAHGVYERRVTRGVAKAGGATPVVSIWACEVCWPTDASLAPEKE